ncbi:hypothetical protein ACJJTC_012481 [Scirpophaga incertulas]
MLCGAIWSAAPVSLRGLAPPLPAQPALLAALVMHALHDARVDDDSSFIAKCYRGSPAALKQCAQSREPALSPDISAPPAHHCCSTGTYEDSFHWHTHVIPSIRNLCIG